MELGLTEIHWIGGDIIAAYGVQDPWQSLILGLSWWQLGAIATGLLSRSPCLPLGKGHHHRHGLAMASNHLGLTALHLVNQG